MGRGNPIGGMEAYGRKLFTRSRGGEEREKVGKEREGEKERESGGPA